MSVQNATGMQNKFFLNLVPVIGKQRFCLAALLSCDPQLQFGIWLGKLADTLRINNEVTWECAADRSGGWDEVLYKMPLAKSAFLLHLAFPALPVPLFCAKCKN